MSPDKPEISIIVPIYNAEKTLPRCIDSILSQTFCNFELLLINDGSSDNSGRICDAYAKEDERVIVFHRTNHGVGAARQFGIGKVTGAFTIHVDSDDYIEATMLEELYACAKRTEAEIVYCDYIIEEPGKTSIEKQDFGDSSTECIRRMLLHQMHGGLWNKLIASSLFKENKIHFLPAVNIWEDLYFTIRCFYLNPRISYVGKAFYHYTTNGSSLISMITRRRIEDQITVARELNFLLSGKEPFGEGLICTILRSKNDYLFYAKTYDPRKWKRELPLSNSQIIKARMPFEKKIFCLLANSGLTFMLKPGLQINRLLTKLRCK